MSESEKQPSRREREKLMHRSEIIDAAERIFVKNGNSYATMDEIAVEADFSVGTLYNFFENKDSLFSEVMTKIVDDFLEELEKKVVSEPDALVAISKLILMRLRYAHEHGEFMRIITGSKSLGGINSDGAIPQSYHARYDAYVTEVAGLFQRAMNDGYMQVSDPVYAVLSLEGSINAFSAYWQRQGMSPSLDEQVKMVNSTWMNLMLISDSGDNKS